jgi:prepilin-type N-terminal cleavage/methylation domain-containing protein
MKKNQALGEVQTSSAGFTLIELLVVIFIIGILVSLLLSNILGARQRAEDIDRKNDAQQMKKALRLYYNDNQAYPASIPLEGESFDDGASTVYIKEVPEYKAYGVDADDEQFIFVVTLDNPSDQAIDESQSYCSSSISSVSPAITIEALDYVVCED